MELPSYNEFKEAVAETSVQANAIPDNDPAAAFKIAGTKIVNGCATVVMVKPDGSTFVRQCIFHKRTGKIKKTREWTPDVSAVTFMHMNGIAAVAA